MNLLDRARTYLQNGFSIIPIAANGSKKPEGSLLPKEWNEAGGRVQACLETVPDHAGHVAGGRRLVRRA